MNVIKLQGITKIYGKGDSKTIALDDVNLNVNKGEMLAIMGPSGSGKSTMLNIMGCLDHQTSGELYIDDHNVKNLGKAALSNLRNNKIGFVFQNFALIQGYHAVENVEMPLLYSNLYKRIFKKMSAKKMRKLAIEKLEMLGLGKHWKKYPAQMSGGQQQRVAIARALVNNPEIIIADEPTGALDQKTGKEIMDLLQEINRSGTTILIVTHDEKVASCCNRVITLVDGKIVDDR